VMVAPIVGEKQHRHPLGLALVPDDETAEIALGPEDIPVKTFAIHCRPLDVTLRYALNVGRYALCAGHNNALRLRLNLCNFCSATMRSAREHWPP
jgi:hypothetical protein